MLEEHGERVTWFCATSTKNGFISHPGLSHKLLAAPRRTK